MNGWNIWYWGENVIYLGWYENDTRIGNKIGSNFEWKIVNYSTGWYENNRRIGPMKEDEKYKIFKLKDVVVDMPEGMEYDGKIEMDVDGNTKETKIYKEVDFGGLFDSDEY